MKAWMRDQGIRSVNCPVPNSKGHDKGKLSQTWQPGSRREMEPAAGTVFRPGRPLI